MTIDEAIENLKYDIEIDMYIHDISPQIAEWLEELKAYKQNTDICPMCDTYCSYLAEEFENGYNKALDDFVEKLKQDVMAITFGLRICDIDRIAEQLRTGGKE